jgi:hypothetical protein
MLYIARTLLQMLAHEVLVGHAVRVLLGLALDVTMHCPNLSDPHE